MFDAQLLSAELPRLPLPLAQTLRRALNAKSPQEAHTAAYYFFESALKLSTAAQVGVYVQLGAGDPALNELLENLTRASTGHWLAMLRELSAHHAKRSDKSLVPLADVSERFTKKEPRPAARAFLDFAAKLAEKPDGRKSLSVLDFFDTVVSYRNQELGHGAQRTREFYAEAAPLILNATVEALNVLRPLGELQLAVSREIIDPKGNAARIYQRLAGDGVQAPVTGVALNERDKEIPAGRVVLAGGAVRVMLYPLVVYEVDELERERVGFLNLVSSKRVAAKADQQHSMISVKRVEYLDYDSGARIAGQDAVEGLAQLLTRLRGKPVSAEAVEQLAAGAETTIITRDEATPGTGQWIGDFEILEELGRGGMGIVYKARQGSLGRLVALKVLPPALAGDPVAVARFKREVAALGRCDHPNVVKVLTAGQDGDRYFYAMEYVEGCDLAGVFGVMTQWLAQSGGRFKEGHLLAAVSTHLKARKDKTSSAGGGALETLPQAPQAAPVMPQLETGDDYYKRISQIIADAARGVGHLHEHGIVHRDLKPGNIMLTQDGKRAIVMDLGLAQMQGGGASLTQSNVRIVGTLRYMPPEQLQRHLLEVTPLADVYSLGATLYELACLAPMFDGDSEARLIQQVLQEQPKAPRSANPALPDDLATIINVATAKAPAERYASAEKFANDLEAFTRGEPISVRPPGALHYLKLFYRRNKAMTHTAAAALLLLIALSAWFVVNLDERRAEAESARDDAEKQRLEAEKQAMIARQQAKLAKDNADLAADEQSRANRAKFLAQEAEAKSREEARRATRAETVTRQRLAESRVLQADALFSSGRHTQAKLLYAQASDELLALGASSFNADLGWAMAEDRAPDPLVVMPGSPYGNIASCAFSSDAGICAMAASSEIALWDTLNWKELRRLQGSARLISCLAFSPDGTLLASGGGDKCVAIWRVSDGKMLHRLSGHGEPVSALAFSPDGKFIVSGDRTEDAEKGLTSIRFWNAETGKEAMILRGPVRSTAALAFSADGQWLAACNTKIKAAEKRGRGVQVWRVSDGNPYFLIDTRDTDYCACTFSPDGKQIVAGSVDGRISAWNLEDFKVLLSLPVVPGSVDHITWAPGGRSCLVAGQYGQLCQFRPADGTVLREFTGHTDRVLASAFLGDESCVSAGADNSLRIWNLGTGLETRGFEGHNEGVYCVAISPDGRVVASGGHDNQVKLWDSRTGILLSTLRGHRMNIGALEFSPDGKWLASGEATLGWQRSGKHYSVRIWDALTKTEARVLDAVEYPVYGVMFTPDGQGLLTGGTANVLDLWDVNTGKQLARFSGHSAVIWAAHFSADGKTLLSGSSDGTLRLWESATGKETARFELGAAIHSARFSRDGTFIAAGMVDGSVRLISAETGRPMHYAGGQFRVHGGSVDWISFLDDDRSIVTMCNRDQAIVVSDFRAGGTVTRSITPSPGIGERGRFSADGRIFVSPTRERAVSVWEIGRGLERRPLWAHAPDMKFFWTAENAGRIAVVQATELGEDLPNVRSLVMFDGESGRPLWAKELERDPLRLEIAADGSLLLIQDTSYKVHLIDGQTGAELGDFKAWHSFKAAFSGDGSLLAACGRDAKVRVFKPRADIASPALTFETPADVISVIVSNSGKYVALAHTDQIARIYDPAGKLLHAFEGHSAHIRSLAFNEDETLLATGDDKGEIRLWSLQDGSVRVFRGHTRVVNTLAFFGGCMLSAGDATLRVWDLASGGELRSMVATDDFRAVSARLSPALFADASDNFIYVWNLALPRNTRQARASLELARAKLRESPRDSESLMQVGRWFALRGREDWAVEFFERAKAGIPAQDSLLLAGCYLEAGRLESSDAALDAARKAGHVTEDGAKAFKRMQLATARWRAHSMIALARHREALPWLSMALRLESADLNTLYLRGCVHLRMKNMREALADFDAMLALDGENVDAHVGRASAFDALGQLEDALAEYRVICKLLPGAVGYVLRAADCLFKLKRYEECVAECTAGLEETFFGELMHKRASAYWELGKWAEAEADYSVLKKKRKYWFDYVNAAYCEAKIGKFDEALADIDTAFPDRADYNAPTNYIAACVYALRAATHPATEEGNKARAEDIASALDCLEQSASANFGELTTREKIAIEPDFAALREEARFKKLVGK